MKNVRITSTALASLFAFAILATVAKSDSITLNDGTVYEGDITAETADMVTIEVQMTPTIKDEKTIARSDIAKISKLSTEDRDFEKIQKLLPTPSLLSTSDYDSLIRAQPKRFLSTYPASLYKKQVEKILTELEAEKAKVAEGFIKLDNSWISPEDQRRDRANVDAKILYFKMEQKAAAGDNVGALRDFDVLERDFGGTESFLNAIDKALEILPAYDGYVNSSLRDYAYRMEERKKNILLLPEHERKENEALFKKELERQKAAAASDKKLGYRWTPLNLNSDDSLKSASKLIGSEMTRLRALDKDTLRKASVSLDKVKILVDERKLREARVELDKAKKIVKTNLYVAAVEKRVEKLAEDIAEEAAAREKTKTQEALAIMNTSGSVGDASASASSGNALSRMQEAKRLAAAKEKQEATPKSAAAPKPKPATAARPNPAAGQSGRGGGGISFQTIIYIVAGLLIVATGSALVIQKKKGG